MKQPWGRSLVDHLGTEFSGFFARKKATKLRPQLAPLFYIGLKHADSYSTYILLL